MLVNKTSKKLHELSVDISQNQMNDIISEIHLNFTDAAIETLERMFFF
jgi:hypothetical protein